MSLTSANKFCQTRNNNFIHLLENVTNIDSNECGNCSFKFYNECSNKDNKLNKFTHRILSIHIYI